MGGAGFPEDPWVVLVAGFAAGFAALRAGAGLAAGFAALRAGAGLAADLGGAFLAAGFFADFFVGFFDEALWVTCSFRSMDASANVSGTASAETENVARAVIESKRKVMASSFFG